MAKSEDPVKVYIDWGNDSVKYQVGSQPPVVVRSVLYEVPSYYQADDFQPLSQSSPLIEVAGVRRHWGTSALLYGQHDHMMNKDKAQYLKDGLYMALGGLSGKSVDLTISVPSIKRFNQQFPGFCQAIAGLHTFIYNGSPCSVHINSLKLLPESYGSMKMAQKLNMAGKRLTLLVDIGAGTAIYSLYTAEAKPVAILTREKSGIVSLVNLLRKDPALSTSLGDVPDTETLLEALRSDFRYGYQAQDISEYVVAQGKQWVRAMVDDAIAVFSEKKTQIDSLILTGGGAIVASKIGYSKGVLPDSHLANLSGMALE